MNNRKAGRARKRGFEKDEVEWLKPLGQKFIAMATVRPTGPVGQMFCY